MNFEYEIRVVGSRKQCYRFFMQDPTTHTPIEAFEVFIRFAGVPTISIWNEDFSNTTARKIIEDVRTLFSGAIDYDSFDASGGYVILTDAQKVWLKMMTS